MRKTGECICSEQFTGQACDRFSCITATATTCSGHGQCMSMEALARRTEFEPLSQATYYRENQGNNHNHTSVWDYQSLYGCLCDSSWAVGYAANQMQFPEFFGFDCSQRRCPSGDDPLTTFIDETNCEGIASDNSSETTSVGEIGNLCYVECANRGVCDYNSGTCACFDGFSGVNCATQNVFATYKVKDRVITEFFGGKFGTIESIIISPDEYGH